MSSLMPQAWTLFMATCPNTSVASTRAGIQASPFTPLPSCPDPLLPQQYALAPDTPQLVADPADTELNRCSPRTSLGADSRRSVPSPLLPSPPSPQQYAFPILETAHVWFEPALIE